MFLSWINGHQRASEWPGSAPASQRELATGVGKFRPAVTPGSAQRFQRLSLIEGPCETRQRP